MDATARHYLDHNATSPLRDEARLAMIEAMGLVGNASSIHQEGRQARARIEKARDAVARLSGASARDVIFTSGGTEANALALTPGLKIDGSPAPFTHLLVGATEHVCVLEGHRFPTETMRRIEVDAGGLIKRDHLAALLEEVEREKGRALVAVQAANNETGIVQPIAEFALLVHQFGGILHCDAVQAAGRLPLDQVTAGADMIALSAHKIGGPQGVGALVMRSGGISIVDRMMRGGGQERGARSGTENVAGIAGFGAAASASLDALADHARTLQNLRDRAEAAILALVPDAVIFGRGVSRLPNTVLFSIPGISAETALMAFDLAGIALSSGSACSSGKVRKSHVLDAMGVSGDLASGALRLSFGLTSGEADLAAFSRVLEKVVRQRKTSARAA
jgi:cysteine desulfurase